MLIKRFYSKKVFLSGSLYNLHSVLKLNINILIGLDSSFLLHCATYLTVIFNFCTSDIKRLFFLSPNHGFFFLANRVRVVKKFSRELH